MTKATVLTMLFFMVNTYKLSAQSDTTSTDKAIVDKKPDWVSRVKVHGYLKDLSTLSIPLLKGDWCLDHLIHNRLNLKWFATEDITLTIEARNRLFLGESIKNNPQYASMIIQSLDVVQIGGVIAREQSFLLHSVVDRANLSYLKNNWQIIVGKQRINWSKSYAWNPNDWFNAYSFFDFDYEERRGTDAALVRYSLGALSSLDFASNYAKDFDKMTMGVNYRFNKNEYDFQLLSGKYESDLAIGGGWAGQIKGVGFKGEVSYFHPYKTDTVKGALIGDVSLDYTLPSTVSFRLETIMNTNPTKGDGLLFLIGPVTAKRLIYNHVSAFASVGYDITPLIKANIGSIWNIDDKSFFINPSLTLSLNDNTEFLLASQLFQGATGSLFEGMGSYVFTRLKWNF